MNIQYFIRVAACAAIVALVMNGAGLFPAQSGAEQEITPGTLQGAADSSQETGRHRGGRLPGALPPGLSLTPEGTWSGRPRRIPVCTSGW